MAFLSVLSLSAACSVLIAILRYGPGISPDSTNYIAAARSILSGEGILCNNGAPFLKWPPLLPAMMALLGLSGIDVAWLGGILNAIAFGGIVAVSGLWLYLHSNRCMLPLLGTVWIAASVPLFSVSHMLWSEPLFILFTILFLWYLHQYLLESKLNKLAIAGGFVAFASLTRYIGITLGVTGCALILLASKGSLRKRLLNILIFGAIASPPLTLWLARNWLVAGTLTGGRAYSSVSFMENVSRAGQAYAKYFFPHGIPLLPGSLWSAGIIGVVLCMFVVVMYRRYKRGEELYCGPSICLLAFGCIYVGTLLISATLVSFDPLNCRLLSPVYVPGVLLGFFTLDELVFGEQEKHVKESGHYKPSSKWLVIAMLIGTVVWACVYATWCSDRIGRYVRRGAGGYNSKEWHESETVSFVRSHELTSPIYSNDPYAMYFLAGIKTKMTPFKRPGASQAAPKKEKGKAFIVWFDRKKRSFLYDLQELKTCLEMEPIARLSDGSVWKVGASSGKRNCPFSFKNGGSIR